MGKTLWMKLSQGGALVTGAIGLFVPGMVGRSYRERMVSIEMDAKDAIQKQIEEIRLTAVTPVDDVEGWNSDLKAVADDLCASFDQIKAKIDG